MVATSCRAFISLLGVSVLPGDTLVRPVLVCQSRHGGAPVVSESVIRTLLISLCSSSAEQEGRVQS